ncbi:hypothetical protein GCM10020256_48810 [Streptomyces thermocoprophilus]
MALRVPLRTLAPPQPKGGWRESGDPAEIGGLLYDLGSHVVDQALVLFGPAVRVYAESDVRRAGAAADDDTFIAITHAGGVRSHLYVSATAAQLGPPASASSAPAPGTSSTAWTRRRPTCATAPAPARTAPSGALSRSRCGAVSAPASPRSAAAAAPYRPCRATTRPTTPPWPAPSPAPDPTR